MKRFMFGFNGFDEMVYIALVWCRMRFIHKMKYMIQFVVDLYRRTVSTFKSCGVHRSAYDHKCDEKSKEKKLKM